MFVYQQRPFAKSLQTQGKTNWTALLFTGAVPADQGSIPFDDQNLDDLFGNCIAFDNLLFDSSYTYGEHFAAFTAGELGSRAGNHYLNNTKGKYALRLDSKCHDSVKESSSARHFATLNGSNSIDFNTELNAVFEFHLKGSYAIDEISVGLPNASYRPDTIGIEAWVTDAWVEIGEIVNGAAEKHNVTVSTTTDKIRLVHKAGAQTSFQLNALEAWITDEPAADNTIAPVTWAILRPDEPSLEYEASGNKDKPFLFMTAGGPQDVGVDMVINRVSIQPGDNVTVVNCKFYNGIWEA